ncbi:Y-family DNA polymerase [Microbulbifer variabilis]|uniref:DNA polymerase Y family protein n=1 Tax=Microbulbifer variabilis TaxID=266805 RepID=A0ABY4V8E6_9GAMM|nr:DNA polymerase Y family protein [Microbulbifer variabilis]USD20534.1 DNA polymerase Y family protein [Microbulbifer variabilis]
MLWLCIQFPKLPLEALTRAQTPEERSQPLAIVEKQIIVEVNKTAFEYGVIAGLSIARARQLCPGLQILRRNRERELQLEELAHWGLSLSAMICIKTAKHEESYRHPQLYLELGNRFKTDGGFRALLHKIQQELTQIGISHRMGLSHSPSAALLLSQLPEHRRWLQQTHTPPTTQQWKQWISHAPSKLLECDNKTLEKLNSHGFKRISQLLSAPLSEIESHFGRSFIDYLARLNSSQQKTTTCNLFQEHGKQIQCRKLNAKKSYWQTGGAEKKTASFSVDIFLSQLEEQAQKKIALNRKRNDTKSQKLINKLNTRLGQQALSGITMK